MAGAPAWKVDQLNGYLDGHKYSDGLKASEKLLKKYPNDPVLLVSVSLSSVHLVSFLT